MTNHIEFNAALNRYEQDVEGHVVFANVRHIEGVVYIDYVEAPKPLRGSGAAGRFMTALMALIRAQDLRVVPICGYAATWLRRHTEFSELINP